MFIKYFLLLLVMSAFFFNKSEGGIINVKTWGAKGDGKADDTKSIQAAINAANPAELNTIYFPKGVYLINSYTTTSNYLENYFILVHSNIEFKGENENSILRLGDHLFDKSDSMANAHIFYGININNIHFSNLFVDMNGKNNLVPLNVIKNNCAIFIYQGNNISLKNLTIKNCAGTNMVIIKGTGNKATIEKCNFINGGNYVGDPKPNNHQIDFSFIYSEWDSTIVISNHIEQQNIEIALTGYSGGIEIHGSYSTAANNIIIGCYPGIYITSGRHPMEKTSVENNQMLQCVKGVSFWVNYPMNNIIIKGNTIELTYARSLKPNINTGIDVPNGNATIYGLNQANNAPLNNVLITQNIITSSLADSAKDITAGMSLHSLQNSIISENIISGMNYGGLILQGSKWGTDSLNIVNNSFKDFKPNHDENAVGGYIVITDTYSTNPASINAPGIKKVYFSNNKFSNSNNRMKTLNDKAAKGKFFGAFIALPEFMHKQIHFSKNNFSDKEEKVYFVKTD